MSGDERRDASPMVPSCDGCALSGRREFLRDVAGAIAAGLAGAAYVGLPRQARALALRSGAPGLRRGNVVSYPIPADDGATIDTTNDVIVARSEGAMYAFNLSCPHQNTALRWLADEHRFQCPKHKSRYQPDGTFISGRATRGMDRFAIRRAGDDIAVDLDALYHQDEQPDAWAGAVVRL
jgi:Rieske Fe-S protein